MTTILIPARGGSVRVPRKGLQKVGGKTLIQRAVETAMNAHVCVPGLDSLRVPGSGTCVVFLSDDDEMLTEALAAWTHERCNDTFLRVEKLPARVATSNDGVPGVCKWYADVVGVRDDDEWCRVVLQPTSPFVTALDLRDAIDAVRSGRWHSVVSVTPDGKGYRRNGAIYATLGKYWAQGQCVGGPTLFHVMPPERSIDIDTMDDLMKARRMAGDPVSLECGADGCDEQATSMVREQPTGDRYARCARHAFGPEKDRPWLLVSRVEDV